MYVFLIFIFILRNKQRLVGLGPAQFSNFLLLLSCQTLASRMLKGLFSLITQKGLEIETQFHQIADDAKKPK